MSVYNTQEIMEILPHRHPFLLIDTIEELEPGVLIMEALAQTGAVAILSLPEHRGKTAYFAGIDKAKFKQMVRPGDTLELETTIIRSKGPVGVGEAIATVNGKLAAKAELTFALK